MDDQEYNEKQDKIKRRLGCGCLVGTIIIACTVFYAALRIAGVIK